MGQKVWSFRQVSVAVNLTAPCLRSGVGLRGSEMLQKTGQEKPQIISSFLLSNLNSERQMSQIEHGELCSLCQNNVNALTIKHCGLARWLVQRSRLECVKKMAQR